MAVRKEKSYLIDVAKQHKYRNQSEEYHKKYLEWRTDPKNPFGYTFVHDSRIRTYVDGEGFIDETPENNERTALRNCCRVMGAALLIMVSVAFVRYFVMNLVFDVPYGGRSYHSDLSIDDTSLPTFSAYAMLLLNILEYLLPIIFLKAATRMPTKIAVPMRRSRNVSAPASILMMLVIMVIGRICNNIMAQLLYKVNIDIPYYDYIKVSTPAAEFICGIGQHVLIAILIEIIFRGYLLQMFRQFGDAFAVVITSLAGCMMLYDISQIGYMFCVGLFTGTVTLRSGSIKNACLMRVIARYVNYILSFVSGLVGAYWATVIDLSVCGVILLGAVAVYIKINSRKRWSFDVSNAHTSLSKEEKFRMLTVSPWFWIWVVGAMAMSVLLVKIL